MSHKRDGIAGTARGTVGNYLNVQQPLFLGKIHNHPTLEKWRDRKQTMADFTRYILTEDHTQVVVGDFIS